MNLNEAGRRSEVYRAGIYARVSVEKEGRNSSMETQIGIAVAYLKNCPDMVLYDCYQDLGKSGMDFERDGFRRMMEDVRRGTINCIIVKDLSRLGRDSIETGNYIRNVFPFFGVRLIAVTDGFDSLTCDGDDLNVRLKNLVNELYARTVSWNVQKVRRAQWEAGSYTGGTPPYGYGARQEGRRKILVIEEESARIVRELFRGCEGGRTMKELVQDLYGNRVHRPADYVSYGHVFWREGETLREWNRSTIRMMLTNPVYLGWLVQGRACGKILRSREEIAREGWKIREKTHEAIVDEEQFFRAAARFGQRMASGREDKARFYPAEDRFEGLLFCGSCRKKMARAAFERRLASGEKVRSYSYYCRNSSRIDAFSCKKRTVTMEILQTVVTAVLRQEFCRNKMTADKLIAQYETERAKQRAEWEQRQEEIRRLIAGRIREGSGQYLKYRNGVQSREDFLHWKEEQEEGIRIWRQRSEEIGARLREEAAEEGGKRAFLEALCRLEAEPDGALVHALIERIRMYPDRRIEVVFRYGRGKRHGEGVSDCAVSAAVEGGCGGSG